MKVTSLPPAPPALNTVKSRSEGEGGAAQNSYEQMHGEAQDQKKSPEHSDSQVQERARENSVRAVTQVADEIVHGVKREFDLDAQVKASGIQAEIVGQGASLRVILRDAIGRELRRMSGAEFVRMHDETRGVAGLPGETHTSFGLRRGKLLDRKA